MVVPYPFLSNKSDYICFDLLLLILRWFPVQTLLVCRCVCKSWKQIIDSKSFILDHMSVQKPRILLQRQNFEYHLLDPNNPSIYHTLRGPHGTLEIGTRLGQLHAVGTAHGVICLYDNGTNLLLWNPSIRRHLRIPIPLPSPNKPSACNNTRYFKYCGFWIDPCTKDFKVVIFFTFCGVKGGSLFSSRDQAWRELPKVEFRDFYGDIVQDCESPQVLIDGVAHWAAISFEFDDVSINGFIVYFDFGREKFGRIDLPETGGERSWHMHVSKWRGFLSIVNSVMSDCPVMVFDLWVLQDGSWSKMASFSMIEDMVRVLYVLEVPTQGRAGVYMMEEKMSSSFLSTQERMSMLI